MRNKNIENSFGCFLTFGKMLSFHIATNSDRQPVWSRNDGDIQIFFWYNQIQ